MNLRDSGSVAGKGEFDEDGAVVGGFGFVEDLTLADGLDDTAVAGDIIDDPVGGAGREGVVGAVVGDVTQEYEAFLHLGDEGGGRLVVPVATDDEGLVPTGRFLHDNIQGGEAVLLFEGQMGAGKDILLELANQKGALLVSRQGDVAMREGLFPAEDSDTVLASGEGDGRTEGAVHAKAPGEYLGLVDSVGTLDAAVHFLQADDIGQDFAYDLGLSVKVDHIVHPCPMLYVVSDNAEGYDIVLRVNYRATKQKCYEKIFHLF